MEPLILNAPTTSEIPEIKATPSVPRGAAVIAFWNTKMQGFLFENPSKKRFQTIFKELGDHLYNKPWEENFGHFFINMDGKNQVRLLNHLTRDFQDEIDLTFPDIPGWEAIGAKFKIDKHPAFNQEMVRTLPYNFTGLTVWDSYPHDLVWLRKFIVYALNHGIDDEDYIGETFGNYENWIAYYNWLPIISRLELCKKLVTYS